MADVWLGRFSRWLEKLFNVKGGPLLVDVMPSVQSVISLQPGVEERYLIGWNRFAVVATQAAVAANNSRCRIRNPVGSNVVLVLEQLSVFTTSATDAAFVTWGTSTGDLPTLVTLTFTRMDPRGQPQPTAIVSTTSQAAGGQAFLERPYVVNTAVDFIQYADQQIPVLPGQAVDIQALAVNTQLVTTLMWRERALESSELT